MILEKQTEILELNDGDSQESFNTEIDIESLQFLKQMLSKFYSDAIGSLIREITSNALDSHREASVNEPIIVSFKQQRDGNYEFSVKDFGVGIDKDTIDNILRKYGKSTRRNRIDQLGAYGLGWKSPLAYTSSFHFIGRKNGMETKAMMYEGEDDIKIDVLIEIPTTERNGVEVIVPVKRSDVNEFNSKIKSQLAYFEGVYLDCGYLFKNDFKIIRSEHFQWSEINTDSKLHISLDNVYYPIDFDKLGIAAIYSPIAIRLSLTDGVFPVPNREQLKYTKEAKEVILNKISLIADYFIEKYNEKFVGNQNFVDIFNHYSLSTRCVNHPSGSGILEINSLIPYGKKAIIDPQIEGLTCFDTQFVASRKDYLLHEYSVKYTLSYGRFTASTARFAKRSLHWKDIQNLKSNSNYKIYKFTDDISNIKKEWFRSLYPNNYCAICFVKKDKQIPLGRVNKFNGRGYEDYYNILNLSKQPKAKWREIIKEWQALCSRVANDFGNLDRIDVPKDWLDERKRLNSFNKTKKEKVEKGEGDFLGKLAQPLERYVSDKHCKFVTHIFNIEKTKKAGQFIVYGSQEQEPVMQKLYSLIRKRNIQIVLLSDREVKRIDKQENHNLINNKKFMEGKHKIYKRLVTSYLIHILYEEYRSVFQHNNIIKLISTSLGERIEELYLYKNEHFLDGNEELYKAMIKVADEFKLYDTSIYSTYKEVKFVLERLPFIEPMFDKLGYRDEENVKLINCIKDLFKYYRQRMDWQNYKLPINEEVTEIKDETLDKIEDETIITELV